jgi:hypothetical protein
MPDKVLTVAFCALVLSTDLAVAQVHKSDSERFVLNLDLRACHLCHAHMGHDGTHLIISKVIVIGVEYFL